MTWLDLCPFGSLNVKVTNEGDDFTSDYAALAFISGEYGPYPRPHKQLVAYTRLHDIAPGESKSAELPLTLNSLSRVDEKGRRILYPGKYRIAIDTPIELADLEFELDGPEVVLDEYPVDPRTQNAVPSKPTFGAPTFGAPTFDQPSFETQQEQQIMEL